MAGEAVTSVQDAAKAKGGESDARQRSTIAFPYVSLKDAEEMAKAIYGQVGAGDCDDDQLAAWTGQSPKSSGYRTQLSAARLFGVLETGGSGKYRLTELGRMIVDAVRQREARAEAFLRVPLFKQVFEKYRGGAIPPPAALERDLVGMGVAEKLKDRARRTLASSAQEGGFFDQGRDRLVRPGVAKVDVPPVIENDNNKTKKSGGDGGGGLPPFIQGLLDSLPDPKTEWPAKERVQWLQTAANIFDLMYKGDGGIEVRMATAGRSPRPE